MSVEVQSKPSWPTKVGTLFGKSRSFGFARENREKGVIGVGDKEEIDEIQNIAGTQIAVNQSQSPPLPIEPAKESTVDDKQQQRGSGGGETSQVASLRRRSDGEIQVADDEDDDDVKGDDNQDEIVDKGITDRIEFYRKDHAYFWLSNSSEHAVHLDGIRYPTAEHLFQATKFLPHRPDLANKIRKISSPMDAIKEARKNQSEVKKGWIGKGGNVASMRDVMLLKYTQHSVLKKQLLLTGDAELVLASPSDAFWGNAVGVDGSFGGGRNEFGKALIKTRDTLRSQAGIGIGSGAKTV